MCGGWYSTIHIFLMFFIFVCNIYCQKRFSISPQKCVTFSYLQYWITKNARRSALWVRPVRWSALYFLSYVMHDACVMRDAFTICFQYISSTFAQIDECLVLNFARTLLVQNQPATYRSQNKDEHNNLKYSLCPTVMHSTICDARLFLCVFFVLGTGRNSAR